MESVGTIHSGKQHGCGISSGWDNHGNIVKKSEDLGNDGQEKQHSVSTPQKTPHKPLPSLMPFKIGFYLVVSSRGIVSSFLPLYFKQVGLRPSQIGTVMFFRPLGGFLGGLLAPHISRTFSNQRRVALTFFCMVILFTVFMSFPCPVSLAANCPDPVRNISSHEAEWGTNGKVLTGNDRSWMFQTEVVTYQMILFALLLFLADFFHVGVDTLQHAAAMRLLGKENSKLYGTIRAWGALGYATSAISTGLLISTTVSAEIICSQLSRSADYHFLFYTFACTGILNLISIDNVFKETSAEHVDRAGKVTMSHDDVRVALCTPRNVSWLMVLLCRSAFYAVTQGFLNWHLENIGASPGLIGMANCTTTITEFVMFFATPKLIEAFGHTKLVAAGILSYACRFVIFSVMSNPVYIFPVEILEGVMFACIWSSLVTYLSNEVPEEGQTQVQGIIQSLYMMGIAIGFPLSGVLTQLFGAPDMFKIFAVLAAITFLIFIFAQIGAQKQ